MENFITLGHFGLVFIFLSELKLNMEWLVCINFFAWSVGKFINVKSILDAGSAAIAFTIMAIFVWFVTLMSSSMPIIHIGFHNIELWT